MEQDCFFDYTFSTSERNQLYTSLEMPINPYTEYPTFLNEIKNKISKGVLPSFFTDVCKAIQAVNLNKSPAILLKNCPTDKTLPVFDRCSPVQSKYALKNTYISEAFLSAYAELTGTSPVGYKTINNGDKFHDIYPKTDLIHSQSQKSLVTLGFHNDLPNNCVRPEWVNILCMRSAALNTVSTTVIRNIDILNHLDEKTLSILKKPLFFTPHEAISIDGGKDATYLHKRPIYRENSKAPFCYFETRTQSQCEEGTQAIQQLDHIIHKVKRPVVLSPGEFISIANNYSLHAREVLNLLDHEAHKKRWLMKTFNVEDIHAYTDKMVATERHVINE